MALETNDLIHFLIIFSVLFCLYLFVGLYFLRKYILLNREVKTPGNENYIPLLFFFTIILIGIGHLFIVIHDLKTEFSTINLNINNLVLYIIGLVFLLIGFSVYFFLTEVKIMQGRDKYILAILYFTLNIISIILTGTYIGFLFIVLGAMIFLYLPFVYLYLAIKSDGKVRKKALSIFFGSILIFLSYAMYIEPFFTNLKSLTGLVDIQMEVIINYVRIMALLFIFYGFK